MDSVAWKTVAQEFAFDGSWRDIYVFDTDLQAWQRVWDRLRQSGYELVYDRGGAPEKLPTAAENAFPGEGEAGTVSVKFAGIQANCHFFTSDEIEFDFDPGEIQGQSQLDALLAFMRLLSDATGKDAVLTPENSPQIVIFRVRPNQSAVEYHEFGSYREKPRTARPHIPRHVSGILGTISALIATLTLFLGIRGLIWGLTSKFQFAWDFDTYVLLAVTALGCLSAYLSFRLLRAATGGQKLTAMGDITKKNGHY